MALDRNARVLIADADPRMGQQISKRLLDRDIVSDTAADTRVALDSLRERVYSVLLLDLSLPGSGAEAVLEFVSRMDAARRPVILVLACGNAARSLDVELVQIVIRKPCNLKHLAEMASSCVRATAATAAAAAVPQLQPEASLRTVATS
jgi:DNA-binding response OmpR family regulator